MNKVELILAALKPKAKSLGFSSKELQEVAEAVAPSLKVDDDSTDEDVNVAVEVAVNAVLPILGMGQKQANRLLDRYKKAHVEPTVEQKVTEPQPTEPTPKVEPSVEPKAVEQHVIEPTPKVETASASSVEALASVKQIGEQLAQMKALFESQLKESEKQAKAMAAQIKAMQGEKVQAARLKKLQDLVKDSGKFGECVLSNYGLMKFDLEKDDEFNSFLDNTKGYIEAIQQELADKGLQSLSGQPSGNSVVQDKEPFSDADIESLAEGMV